MAQTHPSLNIIGLGAQDSLADAHDFVARTGTGGGEIDMVWDPSFESWREFGIRSQPYWLLFDTTGALVASSPGAVEVDAVESVLS